MLLLICIRIYIKKKVDARKYIQFLEKKEKNETNGNEICFFKVSLLSSNREALLKNTEGSCARQKLCL